MPNPRTPVRKAEVSGAAAKNPQRHRDRKDPARLSLGEAPEWFDENQSACWEGFRRELGWLTESDRALMEIAVPVRALIRMGVDVGVTKLNLYRLCLAQLGASPADRSKIAIPDSDNDDPDAEFYN